MNDHEYDCRYNELFSLKIFAKARKNDTSKTFDIQQHTAVNWNHFMTF